MLPMQINGKPIGADAPVYVIAEMSANHGHRFEDAEKLIRVAKESGADAIKLQTYTPDTMTIRCDKEYFSVGKGTIWEGRNLHDLYAEAYTPWEWQADLSLLARELNLDFFSTPFDATAVDFLESLNVPAYKIASFEIGDIPFLRIVAQTGKPVILSTGMATREEIAEAVQTLREHGCPQLALLKCTSAYPAPPESMNLRTMADLAATFQAPVGLSDHTLGNEVSIAAVAMGACIVERHFTLSRETPGPDSAFSLEPHELHDLVKAIRTVEKSLGEVSYGTGDEETASRVFRRSLFIVEDIPAGETLTPKNVRSIRPGYGLAPRFYDEVLGRRAARSLERGTPLAWKDMAD